MSQNKFSDYNRFSHLTFSDFKLMAGDPELSCYEKIGFPNSFREGKEEAIFLDILGKLTNLQKENQFVIDIGPGCSTLPLKLIELCKLKKHKLLLIDSEEMLQQLPDELFITKIPAFFPSTCKEFMQKFKRQADVILSYSVLHYVFAESNIYDFLDETLNLLNDGGQCLIGDIPNSSKRKRFLSSSKGVRHHKEFYDASGMPSIEYNTIEHRQIDDSVLFGLLMRSRYFGFDAYVVPQSNDLPMANRREDLLIVKP